MSNHFHFIRFFAFITITTLLVSCASQPTPKKNVSLTKEAVSSVNGVQVFFNVSSEQNNSFTAASDTSAAHVSAGSSGNPFADIIGHLIAESLIQSSSSERIHEKDPLLEFTSNIPFEEPYTKKFQGLLTSSNWLTVNKYSHSSTPFDEEDKLAIRKSIANDSVLFGDAHYYFSNDYSRIYISTNIELWQDGASSSPIYSGGYLYCSKPVGSRGDSIESYLEKWRLNSSEHLRNELALGIDETLKMLDLGIVAEPTFNNGVGHVNTAQVDFCGHDEKIKGKVISGGKSSTRFIILSDTGNYYSVSRDGHRVQN